jgi:hypothetical protein
LNRKLKKMKRIKYIVFLLSISLAFGACHRDELTPQSQFQVANTTAFATPARILAQVNGLYGALKSGNVYGGRFQVAGEVKADNFINETNNLITDQDVWLANATNSATAVTTLWQFAYLSINNANLFIDGMNATGTKTVGGTLGAQYIGEAKLVRALSYLALMQFYAQPYAAGAQNKGLPLRLKGNGGPGFSTLARSPVDSVYTQILSDLNDAEAALPAAYATSGSISATYLNSTRATKGTAIAVKTRVYLIMQRYTDVITEANKIVTPGAPFTTPSGFGITYSLLPDITKAFAAPYTTTENILSLPMSTGPGDAPGGQNSLASYFSPTSKVATGGVGTGEFSLNPAGVIADPNWKSTDKRRTFVISSITGTKKWLNKYTAPNPFTDYPAVIRYSEVLLNLAEARARTAGLDAQATALLNAVRQRSDATTTFAPASATELITDILQERNIELLGEGFRNQDLVRLMLPIPAKGPVAQKNPTDQGYIWPISATELSLNTACTDN